MIIYFNEVANSLSGEIKNKPSEDFSLTGVSTDSRNINNGELFIPLIGKNYDGHSFLQMAEKNGALASLWQKDRPAPENIEIPLIIVEDVFSALQKLASYYREKLNPLVIGVTGSNGKTTTKDLISSILETNYKVHKTKGNLNNHIGLPLTLLSMSEDTEVAVLEMGMSGFGEIEVLSKIAKPDIAVITNIGESHIEFLKSRANIAKAKLEIIKGLKEKGWLILTGDEPLIRDSSIDHLSNIIWVGKNKDNDVYPRNIIMEDFDQIRFTTNNNEQYSLPLIGIHNVINGLMAIEVAKLLKLNSSDIQRGLSNIQITGMRLEKMIAKNGSFILNDAYNASPTSMKASLDLLNNQTKYKKKIAVLGDMLELGEQSNAYHKEIGYICASIGIDKLITTGNFGKWIAEGAREKGMPNKDIYYFEQNDKIAEHLLDLSDSETIILVKASRGAHMERIINMLVL